MFLNILESSLLLRIKVKSILSVIISKYCFNFQSKRFTKYRMNNLAVLNCFWLTSIEIGQTLIDYGVGHLVVLFLLLSIIFSIFNKIMNLIETKYVEKTPESDDFDLFIVSKNKRFKYSYAISPSFFSGGFGKYASFNKYTKYTFTVTPDDIKKKESIPGKEFLEKGSLPGVLNLRTGKAYEFFKLGINNFSNNYNEDNFPHILIPQGSNVQFITQTEDNICRWAFKALKLDFPVGFIKEYKTEKFINKGLFVENFSYIDANNSSIPSPVLLEVVSKKEFSTRVAMAVIANVENPSKTWIYYAKWAAFAVIIAILIWLLRRWLGGGGNSSNTLNDSNNPGPEDKGPKIEEKERTTNDKEEEINDVKEGNKEETPSKFIIIIKQFHW